MTAPETTLRDTAAEFQRRRRGRNIAMLVVLLALSGLLFAIAVVKMSRTGIG
jgi:hypothetical protein